MENKKIKNATEFQHFSEVEEILEDLIIRLQYQINIDLKNGLVEDLNNLQETIYKKRKEYQQEKLTNLKTA